MGFRTWGLGFRVWGVGLRIWGLGFRRSCPLCGSSSCSLNVVVACLFAVFENGMVTRSLVRRRLQCTARVGADYSPAACV